METPYQCIFPTDAMKEKFLGRWASISPTTDVEVEVGEGVENEESKETEEETEENNEDDKATADENDEGGSDSE